MEKEGELGEKRQRSRIRRSMAKGESGEIKGRAAEVYAEAAAYLLEGAVDRMLLFGPVVWLPSDSDEARVWRFVVISKKTGETWHDQLGAPNEADTVEMRAGIMAALVGMGSCVMIDFDDELAMAKHAEAAWPCAKITRIRERIEAERAVP